MDITQTEIIRLRMIESPPDLMLEPDVSRIGPLEFYRGKEAVAAGRAVTRDRLAEIKAILEDKNIARDTPQPSVG
jgi:predicted acylesterase/phospholipase RssA